MSKEAYLIIAIVILVALLVTFIVSFVLYKKTPVPKGCENIEINEENCSHCSHKECSHFIGRDKE